MLTTNRTRALVHLLILPWLFLAGCGGAKNAEPTEQQIEAGTLGQVGELIRQFQAEKSQAPKSATDLVSYENAAPLGLQALNNGDVIVFWGVMLPDTNEEKLGSQGEDTVLAYHKDVPAKGGPVLMLNRSVKNMTPEEFKAAKKAG